MKYAERVHHANRTLKDDKYLSRREEKWCICQHSLINLQIGSFSQILQKYYLKKSNHFKLWLYVDKLS